jgi:hypothetical protein
MKKKSASKSAFFNLRVLIGLCIALAGISVSLLGLDAFAANTAPVKIKNHIITTSNDPLVPVGFDCTKIRQLGIDKQENFRAGAIMIACGAAEGGSGSSVGFFQRITQAVKKLLMPLYGATDVNLITGTETTPNITQSETFTWANPDNPQQVVVAYNDSRGRNQSPINISGASVSTDGGATFTRVTNASGQSPFAGTEGDPVLLYNRANSTWFTVWLDTGCGGQGLGGYKSTNPSDPTSWTHFCVHNNSQDDRNSGWADNNPASPFANRMYISWNDFNVGGGALFVTYSSDNGTTWHSPIALTSTFIRDVQITGDKVTGDVYIAGMDEMGGGLGNRANKIFRSTDGGNTWTNTYTGPTFAGPGRTASGFFACMYSSPAYWRHQGWGEPAAFNHVVSLVYAARNTGNSDPGDVFYIRSTDSGVTFSAPFQLNTNTEPTKAQWMPNLSVSEAGTLFATWYDETPRTSASCQPSSPTNLCYQMHSRKSPDNGMTWGADETTSDVASPLPLQGDPGIQSLYAGDYDYGSAILTKHVTSWVDGRNPINGASQQDAYTDRDPVGPTPTASPSATSTATASPTPTATATATPCQTSYTTATSTGTITAGGTDIGNHCDDCTTDITLPFPVSVYGNPPVTDVAVGSDGDIHFPGPYNKLFWWAGCVPVDPMGGQDPFLNTLFPNYADLVTDESVGACPDCGIFTQTLGTAPNRQFVIRWKANYFNSPPGPAQAEFEVLLTEGSNTLSVIYGVTGDNGLTAVSGIQQDLNVFTSFSCDEATLIPGLRVDYIPTTCGSPTPTATPTATATATATSTAMATATATSTATATASATATATATPTATARPSPTPRLAPTPRARPTPPPRP